MQFSHSRVETFNQCQYKFKLRYIDELRVLPKFDPSDPLILGTTLHKYIQESLEEAWEFYRNEYPILTSKHYEEWYKLKTVADLYGQIANMEIEVELNTPDFIGYIDAINEECLLDIKYSKNSDRYADSRQLSLYVYFYKQMTGKDIESMFYLVFPKTGIYKGKKEEEYQFRNRLDAALEKMKPKTVFVDYDPQHVIDWYADIKRIHETTEYEKNETKLCFWCEYQEYCQEGVDYMLLPKNERRNIEDVTKRTIWIYGAPFTGKTTFANDFPNPLMLNTDGNIKFVDAPFISLKDGTEKEGRITKTISAWDTFKDIIVELEAKENDFETIIVDLIEDLYESCRLYMYNKLGISHESDDSFRAWDKVRTEFLSTIRRFVNLDYKNIVLVSHENITKDITKRSGENIKAIQPNISDKPMLKLAGMVDIVGRVVVEGEEHLLEIKPSDHIFGGGRLGIKGVTIPLEYEEFCDIYKTGGKNESARARKPEVEARKQEPEKETDTSNETEQTPTDEPKKRRGRRKQEPVTEEPKTPEEQPEPEELAQEVQETEPKPETELEQTEEPPAEEKPRTRRRRTRTVE